MPLTLTPVPRRQEDIAAPRRVPAHASSDPRLTLLGGFGLHVADKTVLIPPGAQRLISLLALHDTALSRDYGPGKSA